jgi:hypothetical protein
MSLKLLYHFNLESYFQFISPEVFHNFFLTFSHTTSNALSLQNKQLPTLYTNVWDHKRMRQAGRFTGLNPSQNAWDDKTKTEASMYAKIKFWILN